MSKTVVTVRPTKGCLFEVSNRSFGLQDGLEGGDGVAILSRPLRRGVCVSRGPSGTKMTMDYDKQLYADSFSNTDEANSL